MTDFRPLDLPAAPPAEPRPGPSPAADYLRVARPTTVLAPPALEALRRTGIAARLTSAPGPAGAGRVELWVDARELDDALTVLAAVVRHAGLGPADLARVGEERVLTDLGAAGLAERAGGADTVDTADTTGTDPADPPAPTRNPTPSATPYPTPTRPAASRPATARASGPGTTPEAGAAGRSGETRDPDDGGDPDDHFRPAEPESLRTLSRTTVWALVILTVGVVALALSGLVPQLVGVYAPLTSLLGTAAVLVGVGMLVTRLRDGRPDDDDRGGPNGDGAVL